MLSWYLGCWSMPRVFAFQRWSFLNKNFNSRQGWVSLAKWFYRKKMKVLIIFYTFILFLDSPHSNDEMMWHCKNIPSLANPPFISVKSRRLFFYLRYRKLLSANKLAFLTKILQNVHDNEKLVKLLNMVIKILILWMSCGKCSTIFYK